MPSLVIISKKIIAYPITWTLFWLGDGISYLMNTNYTYWLYPLYNKLMIWSGDIQDWGKLDNPWKKVEK